MRSKDAQKIALQISDGLLKTTTDLVLFTFFLTLSSVGTRPTSYGVNRAFDEAHKLLSGFNYETIKQILAQLKQKRLVSYQRGHSKITLTITHEGREKLRELISIYKKQRTWDKHIYLVTYDVPEAKKRHRDVLRKYIKKLGGGLLQESVWLIPYDPRLTLHDFIQNKKLTGVVIVSKIGKDGAIGEENLKELIKRIYYLDDINKRYQEFIKNESIINNRFIISKYLSILKDDPQLPFELLPKNWLGDKAYDIYKKHSPELLL